MSVFSKFRQFVEDVAHGVHDLSSDVLKVALTSTAPVSANEVFADLVEIAGGNGYTAGGHVAAQSSSGQTAGTYKLALADATITASGGAIGPFRYAVLYNSTPGGGPLVGFYDYGSSVTLNAGESLVVDFDAAAGVLTLA